MDGVKDLEVAGGNVVEDGAVLEDFETADDERDGVVEGGFVHGTAAADAEVETDDDGGGVGGLTEGR